MTRPARGRPYAIILVGLPARGKSYTARKLRGYLSWLGYPSRVFNLGEARRQTHGPGATHEYFDPRNETARRERDALGAETLERMLEWFANGGRIGIYDATNSTRARRSWVRDRCRSAEVEILQIELSTEDPDVIAENIQRVKLDSPDYAGVDPERARLDFERRVEHYASVYEQLEADEGPFVRIIDRGRQIHVNEVDGYIPGRILFFLANLQVTHRPIWLTRHGQSRFNLEGRIGGDAELSPAGEAYARSLADAAREHFGEDSGLDVWTSQLRRTVATAAPLGIEVGRWRSLNEINAGRFDGLSYESVRRDHPEEWARREQDKLGYRYPRGESYADVIERVDRVIIELERYRTPVLVIAHRAVLRALYAYFVQMPREDAPRASIPLHEVIEIEPTAYGCREIRRPLPPQVDEVD